MSKNTVVRFVKTAWATFRMVVSFKAENSAFRAS